MVGATHATLPSCRMWGMLLFCGHGRPDGPIRVELIGGATAWWPPVVASFVSGAVLLLIWWLTQRQQAKDRRIERDNARDEEARVKRSEGLASLFDALGNVIAVNVGTVPERARNREAALRRVAQALFVLAAREGVKSAAGQYSVKEAGRLLEAAPKIGAATTETELKEAAGGSGGALGGLSKRFSEWMQTEDDSIFEDVTPPSEEST